MVPLPSEGEPTAAQLRARLSLGQVVQWERDHEGSPVPHQHPLSLNLEATEKLALERL